MIVAFDLETHLIEPGQLAPKPVCASFADHSGETDLVGAGDIEDRIGAHLRAGHTLVAHNAAFDICVLLEWYPGLRPLIWDALAEGRIRCTRIRERLSDIADGSRTDLTLGALVQRFFGVALDKGEDSWRLRYAELEDIPVAEWPEEAQTYAIDDARYCLLLHDKKERWVDDMATQALEVQASVALQLTSAWGFAVDPRAAQALAAVTDARMSELTQALLDDGIMVPKRKKDEKALAAGAPLEDVQLKKSTKVVQWRVIAAYTSRGLPVPQTSKGATSTSKATLEACDDMGAFDDLIEFNALQKTRSNYVGKIVAAGDGALHARYDVLGAASGRTSCSGPNIQNQPRLPGVRECFVARPGHVLIACDYNSQEMRTLAQTCLDLLGRSALASAFQEDPAFDPHTGFAEESGLDRQDAKAGNFGFPGGMGAAKLEAYAKGLGITLTAAPEAIKDAWFARWPEMRDYFRHVGALPGLDDRAAVMIIPATGFKRGGVGFTDGANGYFQGRAATCSKQGLWEVTRRCYDERLESPLLGSRPVAFIHDEVILESPEEWAHEAAIECERVMADGMQRWCEDVPATASATLMRRWAKKAKRVVRDGRLIPSEDAE